MDLSALPHFLDAKGDPLFSNQWGAILNHQLLEARLRRIVVLVLSNM